MLTGPGCTLFLNHTYTSFIKLLQSCVYFYEQRSLTHRNQQQL